LLSFSLRAAHISEPEHYIAYSNSPRDVTDEDRAKASDALARVVAYLRTPSPEP
jgi:hypothetical protein